jgi:hypothetical protein
MDVNRINSNVKLINFDYFVERGTILNEMARQTLTFYEYPKINEAYGRLRKYISSSIGEKKSSTIDQISYRYMYDVIADISDVDNSIDLPKQTDQLKNFVRLKLKELMTENPDIESELISDIDNNQRFDKFYAWYLQNPGNRSRGASDFMKEISSYTIEEFNDLRKVIEPVRKFIKQIESSRKRMKNAGEFTMGMSDFKPEYEDDFDEELSSPNLVYANECLNIISQLKQIRLNIFPDEGKRMPTSKDVSKSLFADQIYGNRLPEKYKNPQNEADYLISKVKVNVFDYFETMFERYIEEGVGQNSEGMDTLIDEVSKSKLLKQLIEYVKHTAETTLASKIEPESDSYPNFNDQVVNGVFAELENTNTENENIKNLQAFYSSNYPDMDIDQLKDTFKNWTLADKKRSDGIRKQIMDSMESELNAALFKSMGGDSKETIAALDKYDLEKQFLATQSKIKYLKAIGQPTNYLETSLEKIKNKLGKGSDVDNTSKTVVKKARNPYNNKLSELKSKIGEAQDEMKTAIEGEDKQQMQNKINALLQQYVTVNNLVQKWDAENKKSEDEEGTGAYMTEQFKRDNKFSKFSNAKIINEGYKSLPSQQNILMLE